MTKDEAVEKTLKILLAIGVGKDLAHELARKIYADVVAPAVDDERSHWLDYSQYFVDSDKLL